MSARGSVFEAAHVPAPIGPPAVPGALAKTAPLEFQLTRYLVFVAVHVLIGLLCKQNQLFTTIYAWGTLLVGVSWASTRRKPEDIAACAAYITGAEVLWRMTKAIAFWEFGKYAVIVVLALACQRWRPARPTLVSTWYFLLLIPSCLFTLTELDPDTARQQISFNLSGPLVLALSAAYFSRLRIDAAALHLIARAALLPVFAMSAAVVFGMVNAKKLTFDNQSNAMLSGGFGPNQVTTVFGAAILFAILTALLLCTSKDRAQRAFWLAAALLFGAQAALTFSRSGLYLCGMSIAAAMISTVKSARHRNAYAFAGVALYLVVSFVIYPLLDDFTGGALEARYSNTKVTGRDLLMLADLEVFANNPVLGVGPGMAIAHRASKFYALAAHCEITRALAEHGLLGLISLMILCGGLWSRLRHVRDARVRGVFIASATFGILCMLSNAMRIALPGLMVGLVFATERTVERNPDHR